MLALIWIASGFALAEPSDPIVVEVKSSAETAPVPHGRDAADDVCIWVHPDDPALSTIIGTDKKGGIAVYDLQGRQIQYRNDGEINNVDIRYNFPHGGERIALVIAGNRSRQAFSAYRVDAGTRHLVPIGEVPIGIYPVGTCLYFSIATGQFYAFVNSYDATFEQWRLFDDGRSVRGELVRQFRVRAVSDEELDSPGFAATEGCVADDETGFLYVAEEDHALWKYWAEPGRDDGWRSLVHRVGDDGTLEPDIEGLAIYYGAGGTGYLLVSEQDDDGFAVLRRDGDNELIARFWIGETAGIDEVTHTDGIDVTNVPLGPAFPFGIFVAQDDDNRPDHQNFKIVGWERIARSFNPPLATETSWDPRTVGPPPPEPGFWTRLRNRLRALFGDDD